MKAHVATLLCPLFHTIGHNLPQISTHPKISSSLGPEASFGVYTHAHTHTHPTSSVRGPARRYPKVKTQHSSSRGSLQSHSTVTLRVLPMAHARGPPLARIWASGYRGAGSGSLRINRSGWDSWFSPWPPHWVPLPCPPAGP